MKSYDRSDGETSKAYAAFTIYRDMGVSRSLKATTEKYYSAECPPNVRRAKGMRHIEEWSSKYDWVERCKDFDRDRELILREHQRQKDVEEHDRKLEQFRQDNENSGFGLFKMGLRLLAIGDRITKTLEAKDVLDSKDIDLFLAIPSSIKAIANFATTGGDLTADGLLIRQLMEKLKEGESG